MSPAPSVASSSQRGLLGCTDEREGSDRKTYWSRQFSVLIGNNVHQDNLEASGTLDCKSFLFYPVKAFMKVKQAKEEISLHTPTPHPPNIFTEGITLPLIGEVKWETAKSYAKEWLRSPKNLALLLWGTAVGVSGAILFLVMVGLLNHELPKKSQRDTWFEVNNQILTALFTLMCLYLHPGRFLHLYMLLRWQPQDIKNLREVYCKDGTYKPHEWAHMLVVIFLLHLNCFAQYALCGLNWGYKRSQRPAIGVGVCLACSIGATAAAGIYCIVSPLGQDYVPLEQEEVELAETEHAAKEKLEAKRSLKFARLLRKASFVSKDGKLVAEPEWRGGLFDCFNDRVVALLSIFCGFCVFGWNMERMGFGNRFVHIVTFILICTAPYWIFTLAAVNIDNSYVRQGLSYTGIVLCIFGLLYGGFWRINMRKTFGLPSKKWCFGHPALTDCTQWLFCSLCSLCQEVRTSEYYRIRESKFYERRPVTGTSPFSTPPRWASPGPSPLGPEPPSPAAVSFSPTPVSPKLVIENENPKHLQGSPSNDILEIITDGIVMDPPVPPVIKKDETASM